MEIELIKKFAAYENGYNQCLGGDNSKGYKYTDEQRAKMSIQRIGNKNSLGSKWSPEMRQKLSNARKGKYLGIDNWKSKKIINLDTMEVFDSLTLAAQKHNIGTGQLTTCCQRKVLPNKHGVTKTCGGYRFMYYDDYLLYGDIASKENDHYKKVINIDTGKIFDTIKQASDYYGLDPSSIVKTCKGKNKTTGGYKWEYCTNK